MNVLIYLRVFSVLQLPWWLSVKNLPAMQETQETWVRSLGQEDPLEEKVVTYSSTLAGKTPWAEEPGRLQSIGSQRWVMTEGLST